MSMTREERRRARRRRLLIERLVAAVIVLGAVALLLVLLLGCTKPQAVEPEMVSVEPAVMIYVTPEPTPMPDEPWMYRPSMEYSAEEVLAKLVWGEARGCSKTEQAAVVWCVLNRVDSDEPYFPDTIIEVATQRGQFDGYRDSYPVEEDILDLVLDVMARWSIEPICTGDVGRVLPSEYLYFHGDGRHNYFRTELKGGTTLDWSLASPYEEGRP